MPKLSLRTWIRNAAAVFSGHHGAVTRQAEQSDCSRQTVYQHASKLERRLADGAGAEVVDELRAEIRRLRAMLEETRRQSDRRAPLDEDKRRELAVTAFAMGLSLRQIEDLLPAGEAPDHSTVGRWVREASRRAAEVLEALDPACAERVTTLALDEIFFGGGRRWWGSSRRA